MRIMFGTLSLRGLDSYVMPQGAWLLMTGFPNHQQAAIAATNFIVNVRNLQDATSIAVTGEPTLVDARPAIMLTDVNAAGQLMDEALKHPLYRSELAPIRSGGYGTDQKSAKANIRRTPAQPKKAAPNRSARR